MRPTLTIEEIFETPARARVLRVLARSRGPRSTRSLASSAGISHTAAGVVLQELQALGLATRHFIGRSHAFALVRSNIYVRDMILPAVEAEEHVIDELKRDLIDEFAVDSLSLILFGSYAYGEQDYQSDIDVFALVEDARRKQQLEQRATHHGMDFFSVKYGSPLSLMPYTRAGVLRVFGNSQSPFIFELMTTGIILHGLGIDEWGIDEPEVLDEAGVAVASAPIPAEG